MFELAGINNINVLLNVCTIALCYIRTTEKYEEMTQGFYNKCVNENGIMSNYYNLCFVKELPYTFDHDSILSSFKHLFHSCVANQLPKSFPIAQVEKAIQAVEEKPSASLAY